MYKIFRYPDFSIPPLSNRKKIRASRDTKLSVRLIAQTLQVEGGFIHGATAWLVTFVFMATWGLGVFVK